MQSLNGNSASTFPDAHYTISSSEAWPAHWRIVESFRDKGVENGTLARIVWELTNVYLMLALTFPGNAPQAMIWNSR